MMTYFNWANSANDHVPRGDVTFLQRIGMSVRVCHLPFQHPRSRNRSIEIIRLTDENKTQFN